jgi:uncharacterized protein (DUF885 family)
MTALGMKAKYDQLDDLSPDQAERELALAKKHLAQLRTYHPDELNDQDQLSYVLMKYRLEQEIQGHQYRLHNYPVNQMFGAQSYFPSFIINMHQVETIDDARAYIARLNAVKTQFDQLIAGLKIREQKGVIPPKFVLPKVIRDASNVIDGYPFTEDPQKVSALYDDFDSKISKLTLSESERQNMRQQAMQALRESVKPAYETLIAYLQTLQSKAPKEGGAWSLPNGADFYQFRLNNYTTTDLAPKAIHELGLKEVARIHDRMRQIMKEVGYKGDLHEFFAYMQSDPQFTYPQTEAGKQAYLAETRRLIANMKQALPKAFGILPEADLIVKPVEAFREESAGIAFYNSPALDGSRPGIYYVNLHDLSQVPKYEMEALAYHEAIPGHHMQLAISQELTGLPRFRRLGGFTAYVEGWGLYSEWLPKEMGFYQDPYADFGRLSMELWRACRLVVDTGLHWKKWTRQQGIDYLKQNTPASEGEIIKAVERYLVMPGQATAYKIGSAKIIELRNLAQAKLQDEFSLADFHDQILKRGPLPLDILESEIKTWLGAHEDAAH